MITLPRKTSTLGGALLSEGFGRTESVWEVWSVWWRWGYKGQKMMGDGPLAMETTGQIPGCWEELFGQRGNGKSDLVEASQEWLG